MGTHRLDGATENYQTSSNDYNGTLSLGTQGSAGDTDASGYTYALAKYDGQNAGYVLFYIPDFGTTLPQYSYSIWGSSEQYALSHFIGFDGGTATPSGTPSVPEPSTFLLLGAGLVALRMVSNRFGIKNL